MSIPLVQDNNKDSINTSIIAIKRNIERINMLLGLSNSEEIDTSEFVKKSDIVDEVTVGNMQSVTSNAVAVANSYSTSETFTGRYWIDGKPIYRKVFELGAISANTNYTFNLGFSDWETVTHLSGMMYQPNTSVTMNSFPIPSTTPNGGYFFIGIRNDNKIDFRSRQSDYGGYILKVTLEYTKTTD